jgi:hypothetical protein
LPALGVAGALVPAVRVMIRKKDITVNLEATLPSWRRR